MVIGLSTACFCSRCETEDSFQIIKELGAEVCEVYLRTFYEYRPEFAKKYSPLAEGLKVNCVRVLPCNFEPQLLFNSRRIRGDGLYWSEQVMRSAQLFGAENYTFHGSLINGSEADDIGFLSERFNEIIGLCSRYGVKLCLKNSHLGTYNRPDLFGRLKSRCPQLFGALDIREARLSGYPWQMYIKEMQGAISHVYLSDVDSNGRTCLPGKGVYDFKQIFKVLKDSGFDGAVLIESEKFADISELKTSVDFLKGLL